MQNLQQSLQDRDLGHLRAVAEVWGLALPSGPAVEAAANLAQSLMADQLLEEGLASLTEAAREALSALASEGGRQPWGDIERRFGPLRSYGEGRRDREKPWRQPASPLEALWYRGLVARTFADTPLGLQEFGFIPVDLLPFVQASLKSRPSPFGSEAPTPDEVQLVSSRFFDDAVTLLAALRRRPATAGELPPERRGRLSAFLLQPASLDLCLDLLAELGALSPAPRQPVPEETRRFLDAGRSAGMASLARAWSGSQTWNDLSHVPDLTHATRPWPNDPFAARQAVFRLLGTIPLGTWWDLASFVAAVKERRPGFQRPGADFEAWLMQDSRSGRFLRGFEHWDAVEGALLTHLIVGPLHWLGAADLGGAPAGAPPATFRLGGTFPVLSDPQVEPSVQAVKGRAKVNADGDLLIPRAVDPGLRYQLARFCAWVGLERDTYRYRLSGGSLVIAQQQGLKPGQVRVLLNKLADGQMPDRLDQALARFEKQGLSGRILRRLVVELSDPEQEKLLRADRRAARFLKRPIGDHAFLVDEVDRASFLRLASKLGLWFDPGPAGDDSP